MTLAEPYEGEALIFLREGTGADFTEWGHEFQLQISGDIAQEYQQKLEGNEDLEVKYQEEEKNKITFNISPLIISKRQLSFK